MPTIAISARAASSRAPGPAWHARCRSNGAPAAKYSENRRRRSGKPVARASPATRPTAGWRPSNRPVDAERCVGVDLAGSDSRQTRDTFDAPLHQRLRVAWRGRLRAAGGAENARRHSPAIAACSSMNACLIRLRWILPLDVRRIVAGFNSTAAYRSTSCTSASVRRISAATASAFSVLSASRRTSGDDDPLNVVDVDREGRRCIRRQRGVAFLRGLFEILRVVIAAGHDDEVFQTAGDEQILAIDETEIARAQVPCVVAIQLRAEGAFRFSRRFQ